MINGTGRKRRVTTIPALIGVLIPAFIVAVMNISAAMISTGMAEPPDAKRGAPESQHVQVTVRSDRQTQVVRGEVRARAADGGMVLIGDDGRLWILQPDQYDGVTPIDRPPSPGPDEIASRLRAEGLPPHQSFETAHYVIVHNGNEKYARSLSLLLEQLHRGFHTFWKNKRVKLSTPEVPLVAIGFANRASYESYARPRIGEVSDQFIGFYNIQSNRMICHDGPNWERSVATVVHEATHQLAFNTGLQDRLADNPKWLSEGMALFFETPDLTRPGRWNAVGQINPINHARWWRYFSRRPAGSLRSMIGSDARFEDASTAEAAYGEAWALTYYLLRTRGNDYARYLSEIRDTSPSQVLAPEQRIDMFTSIFGDLESVDRALVTYMKRFAPPRR